MLATDLKDFAITATSAQKEAFVSNIQVEYIKAIVNQLQDRFPHVELLGAFSISDPKNLPQAEENSTHGLDSVEILSRKYGEGPDPYVDSDQCASEWESFKRLMKNNYASKSMCQVFNLLCTDQSICDMFPQLSTLASIGALTPVSTAECEQAFFSMNRIKTDLRNRLKTSTLECLMRISIEGPQIADCNFERAADIWGGMRNRRLAVGNSSPSTAPPTSSSST